MIEILRNDLLQAETKVESVPLLQKLFNLGSRPNRKVGSQKDDIKEPATARFFKEWYGGYFIEFFTNRVTLFFPTCYC